jgi:hypothetical protein
MFPLLNFIEMSLANRSAQSPTDSANIPLSLFPNLWKYITGQFDGGSLKICYYSSEIGFSVGGELWGGGPYTRDRSDYDDEEYQTPAIDCAKQPLYRTLHDLLLDLDEFFDAERLSDMEELKANPPEDTDAERRSYVDVESEERSANPPSDRCHCTIL